MFKNETNIPITLAVWLAADGGYDLEPDPKVVSATALLRPLKSLVLGRKMMEEQEIDIDMLVASKLGTATHNSVEQAWLLQHASAMEALGMPKSMIDKISVNPKHDLPGRINVYVEKRTAKEIDGFIVSGKFDFCVDGELHDLKTTKSFSWISGTNDEDYKKQASIYRWLNQDIVHKEYFYIDYLFTDWSPLRAMAESKDDYPPNRCISKRFPLYSVAETEAFIRQKLAQLKLYEHADQDAIPECNRKELWQEPAKWAYYKNPKSLARATKLFDVQSDAQIRLASDGGKGVVVERPGTVKRCHYCEARPICLQAQRLEQEGLLK